MKRWGFWVTASALMLVSGSYSLMNFVAAVDLGYDVSSAGRSVLNFWGYAALVLLAGAIACACTGFYTWRRSSQ